MGTETYNLLLVSSHLKLLKASSAQIYFFQKTRTELCGLRRTQVASLFGQLGSEFVIELRKRPGQKQFGARMSHQSLTSLLWSCSTMHYLWMTGSKGLLANVTVVIDHKWRLSIICLFTATWHLSFGTKWAVSLGLISWVTKEFVADFLESYLPINQVGHLIRSIPFFNTWEVWKERNCIRYEGKSQERDWERERLTVPNKGESSKERNGKLLSRAWERVTIRSRNRKQLCSHRQV